LVYPCNSASRTCGCGWICCLDVSQSDVTSVWTSSRVVEPALGHRISTRATFLLPTLPCLSPFSLVIILPFLGNHTV
jgi:hypothetical protein